MKQGHRNNGAHKSFETAETRGAVADDKTSLDL